MKYYITFLLHEYAGSVTNIRHYIKVSYVLQNIFSIISERIKLYCQRIQRYRRYRSCKRYRELVKAYTRNWISCYITLCHIIVLIKVDVHSKKKFLCIINNICFVSLLVSIILRMKGTQR